MTEGKDTPEEASEDVTLEISEEELMKVSGGLGVRVKTARLKKKPTERIGRRFKPDGKLGPST